MTHEEIRARLYAAHGHISLQEAQEILRRETYFSAKYRADRLLAAHLEITKPLREAADELAAFVEKTLEHEGCHCFKCLNARINVSAALARYRAVKGEGW